MDWAILFYAESIGTQVPPDKQNVWEHSRNCIEGGIYVKISEISDKIRLFASVSEILSEDILIISSYICIWNDYLSLRYLGISRRRCILIQYQDNTV